MTVVGTRPEIIRLSRVMAALDKYMTQVIVHTGQNYDYELNQIFFDDLEIRKPDYFLEAAGKSACETVGMIIAKIDKVLSDINMPYSTISRDYLLREAIPQDRIIKTGSPMYEVLHHYMPQIKASDVLTRLELTPEQFSFIKTDPDCMANHSGYANSAA